MPNSHPSKDPTIRSKSGYSEGDSSSSWTVASDSAVLKKIDKTVFTDHGTRIPKYFRDFFNVESLQPGDKRTIYFWHQKRRYEATIKMTILDFPRTQLSWKKDFSGVLQTIFPNWLTFFSGDSVEPDHIPSLKFVKRSLPWEYDVEFIDEENMVHTAQIHDDLVLTKYQEYSRNDVQKIFDPNSHFTPRSGKWGLRGIITHPSNDNDFIFFVTFGHTQSGYSFDESITTNGIVSWQSEPKQKLQDPIIRRLIQHDSKKNSIHLFLRTRKDRDYTYLGLLSYINHGPKQEQPVHFTWRILDWNLGADKANKMGLELQPDDTLPLKNTDNTTTFLQIPAPIIQPIVHDSKPRAFTGRKTDYTARNQKNTDIGDNGEMAAIEIEKAILRNAGADKLIEKIEHVAKTQGDGLGFDIQSITPDGEKKLIEVKTTVGGIAEPFILTDTEFIRSQQDAKNYYLYRIYDFDKTKSVVTYYVIKGDLTNQTSRSPLQYSCTPVAQHPNDMNYLNS